MGAPRDLLLQLCLEHRDLTGASRSLRRRAPDLDGDTISETVVRIVDHELAHRLLVHPLLRRDRRGRLLFEERREEQLLLADRIRHLLAATEVAAVPPGDTDGDLQVLIDLPEVVTGLDDQFVEHTDREEILAFPHLRRVARPDELSSLGELRERVAASVRPLLVVDGPVIADGRWATEPRRLLPELLQLPEDLVAALPAGAAPAREHVPS